MRIGDKLRKGMRLLGGMLIGEKLATEEQVRAALAEQAKRKRRGWPHRRLGEILVEMSAVAREDVDRVLDEQETERQSGVPEAAESVDVAPEPEKPYLASSSGTVYHTAACTSVRRINPANLVRFSSRDDAEQSGRRPCAKCC